MSFVLVVDDAADVRVLCREVLSRAGHEVVTVASGEEALTFLDRAARLPDLVLLDIVMPVMDGWEVLDAIRASPDTQRLRVVMFSVKSQRRDRIAGFQRGCDGYVSKPFNLDLWLREIEDVLARHEAERTQHRAATLRDLIGAGSTLDDL